MLKSSHPKPRAIVFPYPYHGHITPTINLAVKLASNGFTVTYVQPEFIHYAISKAYVKNDETRADSIDPFAESGLDIHYTTIADAFPVEFDRDANFTEYWESMMLDFPARVDKLVGDIKKSDDSTAPFFLVADSLYSWPAAIAMKHNLVNVSLWTQPAMVFSICSHLELLRENGHFPCKGSDVDLIHYIPGVESIATKDLMSFIQTPDAVPVLAKITLKAFEQVKNADFILCNTLQELEPKSLSALNQKQPTFAIGPINFFTEINLQKRPQPESNCTDWLDSKPPASVLYISFGSIAMVNKQEIKEIAHGLLLSRVNFIWVLRTDSKDQTDVFPVGFLDDVVDRGIIIPWCNQKRVLLNQAVGGFLTHCGWNSILESMWSGVPMICYPFFVDQPTNRKLVVEDWKIGIDLCDGGVVTGDEVGKKINVLMKGETCVELREETKKVSKILRNALDRDGSSQRNFDQFAHDLMARLNAMRGDGLKNGKSIDS